MDPYNIQNNSILIAMPCLFHVRVRLGFYLLQSGVKLFQPSCENFNQSFRKWLIWQAVAACSCWQSYNRENSNMRE